MSIYVNFSGQTATFDLAEVQPVHAGKEMVVELWDPDSGNIKTEIFKPDGTSPSCTWSATGATYDPCSVSYGPNDYDDGQVQIRVDIPDDYTCSGDCWWTIKVTYQVSAAGGARDTTTWSAHIEGNPVSLVE
jgi:hypothetical protein